MKKLIIPLLFIFAIGILAAVESEPSAIVGYVKYPCVQGLNFVALPMDQGYNLVSQVGNTYPDLIEAISYWDASTQSWVASVYYPELEMWDPDFDVVIGMPLMVSSLSSTIWPSGPRLIKSSNK